MMLNRSGINPPIFGVIQEQGPASLVTPAP